MENTVVYQRDLARIFSQITKREIVETKNTLGLSVSDYLLTDIEDCIATGDTLVGTGLVFSELDKFPWKGRRIDVANATAQGLTVLYHWARKTGVPIEVNAGWLSWGLSEGIGEELAHKNYITHAPFPELQKMHKNRIFVVGDMGEASKRITGLGWDGLRRDRYFLDNVSQDEYSYVENMDIGGDLYMAFEKGGLLTVALRKYALKELGKETHFPLIMAIGKRLDLGERGFGLRLDGFYEPLKQFVERQRGT